MKREKIVLIIEPGLGPELSTELERATELAHRLNARLEAHLLADEQLQRAARLPIAREVGLASAQDLPFGSSDLEIQFSTLRAEIERRLTVAAERLGVPWSVVIRSGPLRQQLLEAEHAADWLALTGPSARTHRLFRMLLEASRPRKGNVFVVRTIREVPAERISALVAFGGFDQPVLDLCRQLAKRLGTSGRLAMFVRSLPEEIETENGDSFFRLPVDGWDASQLLQRIYQTGAGAIFAIPDPESGKSDLEALERLIETAELPVVLVSDR